MPKAPILGGSEKIDLDDEVFGVAFNGPLVHEVVVAELAARRRGTHATKTRGLVSGGGATRPPRPPGANAPGRGRGGRKKAVSPEGHRPRAPGLDPLAAVRRRRR